jgi:hypothetical protein
MRSTMPRLSRKWGAVWNAGLPNATLERCGADARPNFAGMSRRTTFQDFEKSDYRGRCPSFFRKAEGKGQHKQDGLIQRAGWVTIRT